MGEKPPSSPRILLFDIETAPALGYFWGRAMHEQDIIDLTHGWYILCFSYKFLGDKRVQTVALPDFKKHYKKDKQDDSALCRKLHSLICEADVIVAHNIAFDIKKSYARFVKHGLPPPSPAKHYCTLKEARRRFAFTSNRLNDLARNLLGRRKLPHSGWDTWRHVMKGCPKAWSTMLRYCAHDCRLLEGIYLKLRAWSPNHPRLTAYTERPGCPTCQSHKVQRRGFNVAVKRKAPRFHCQSCGSWFT